MRIRAPPHPESMEMGDPKQPPAVDTAVRRAVASDRAGPYTESVSDGGSPTARTDLVVLNFGGPQSKEAIEPFLYALFDDPDVIKLPVGGPRLQSYFAGVLSSRRTPKIAPHYHHIGYSPLVPMTEQQVDAVKEALGPSAPQVWVGMRYSAPTIADMVADLAAKSKSDGGPDRIVALALFPHYSGTTTGSAFNLFSEEMAKAGLGQIPVQYVPAFYDHPRYVAAMVDLIEQQTTGLDRTKAHLLFSAHGLPSSYLRDDADPYPNQVQDSVRMIMRALDWPGDHTLCYQSRVGPVRWLKPSTEEELMRLSAAGAKDVVVVPLSFVTEGIETLYEIDVEFGEVAESLGLTLHRVKTVDTHPEFIACLADVAKQAMADDSCDGLGKHRCVRCLLPKAHAHRTKVDCLDCGHRTPEYLLRLPRPKSEG